jgi:hypothetical protein
MVKLSGIKVAFVHHIIVIIIIIIIFTAFGLLSGGSGYFTRIQICNWFVNM